MSRKHKILVFLGVLPVVLFGVYQLLRINHIVMMYTIPTAANAPSMEPNDFVWASSWMKAENGDFAVYERNDKTFGRAHYKHRIVGMEHDTLVMKDGILFRNGKNANQQLDLKHSYLITQKQQEQLIKLFPTLEPPYPVSQDNTGQMEYLAHLSKDQLSIFEEDIKPIISELKVGVDMYISELNSNWTIDNFGPYIVPKGHYFTMGDNRHNAMDGRFFGPIPFKDHKAVVLNK